MVRDAAPGVLQPACLQQLTKNLTRAPNLIGCGPNVANSRLSRVRIRGNRFPLSRKDRIAVMTPAASSQKGSKGLLEETNPGGDLKNYFLSRAGIAL